MKRVVLATVLLVVGGTASAAMFVRLPAPEPARARPAKIGALVPPSAPTIVETGRLPVPVKPLPRPSPPHIASLTEPPPDLSQVRPKPQQPDGSAKAAIERDANKYVRDLTSSDGRCAGRSLTRVTVEPNGTVHVQC